MLHDDILASVKQNLETPETKDPTPTPPEPTDDDMDETPPAKKPEAKEVPNPKEPDPKDPEPKDTKPKEGDDPDKGKKVEIDSKLKTVPYERFKELNDKYKALNEKREAELTTRKAPEDLSDEEMEERARLKKMGMITADEQTDQKFKMQEEQIREEQDMLMKKEIASLETEFDGTDGLPKFDKEKVIGRGIEQQVFNPRAAYVVMHLPDIIEHYVEKTLSDVKKRPIVGKGADPKSPDIAPKEKLSLND